MGYTSSKTNKTFFFNCLRGEEDLEICENRVKKMGKKGSRIWEKEQKMMRKERAREGRTER